MDDKLYLLTCSGYIEGYGTEIYVVGVFTTEERAKSAQDEAVSQMKAKFEELNKGDYYNEEIKYCEDRFRITAIRKNEAYPLEWEEYNGFVNDKYLGGYVE